MIETVRRALDRIPIRVRLTLWYVLLMGLTIAALSLYVFWQAQGNLRYTVDNSLQIAVAQARSNLDDTHVPPVFRETTDLDGFSRELSRSGLSIRLLSAHGEVQDQLGAYRWVPDWGPVGPGYRTQQPPSYDDAWRVYTVQLRSPSGELVGWLQASQSLDTLTDALEDLREQLFWVIPLVLLFSGLVGYFLASRALRPIDRITRTAQQIGGGDLSQRLRYSGPADEVGRLARTFDEMLSRLQAAFERERRFTADAAHELRTPLSVLRGMLEVTLSRQRTDLNYRETLQELDQHVERLIRLSNGLLFLSRVDQEKGAWVKAPVNLTDLLESIVEQIQPLADQKVITLHIDLPAGLTVTGDPDHLISLFLNLLDNALKYTPELGSVGVTGRQEAGEARIEISDNGPGITPDDLPKIFDRFYRVESSRSRSLGGAGLGLAIAQEIARAHRGRIIVRSDPGHGTCFTVCLPMNA